MSPLILSRDRDCCSMKAWLQQPVLQAMRATLRSTLRLIVMHVQLQRSHSRYLQEWDNIGYLGLRHRTSTRTGFLTSMTPL